MYMGISGYFYPGDIFDGIFNSFCYYTRKYGKCPSLLLKNKLWNLKININKNTSPNRYRLIILINMQKNGNPERCIIWFILICISRVRICPQDCYISCISQSRCIIGQINHFDI